MQPPECTQIANSDADLLWDVADKFINNYWNDLKKLANVLQSTNKSSLEFKKYPLNSSFSKKSENHINVAS